MASQSSPENSFYLEISRVFREARSKTITLINTAMVDAYWLAGKRIVEEEQNGASRADYGIKLITELSKKLTSDMGRGFSVANLKNFRQFYTIFPGGKKSYAPRSQLSWTHYRLIMRLSDLAQRNWYLQESGTQNWTSRQLERNINTRYYERLLSSKNKSEILLVENEPDVLEHSSFIKDPYLFEFLGIPEPLSFNEAELENRILSHLQHFLLELGKGFAFVGRQYRISTETNNFYLDLVFYNYLLKCFILFDLKTGRLSHQDVGQMDMYVKMFDDLNRTAGDGPTIGIILCSDKDATFVKYSVLNGSKQVFASRYHTIIPTEKEFIEEIEKERHIMQTNSSHNHP